MNHLSKNIFLFNIFIINLISFEVLYSSLLLTYAPNNAFIILLIIYLICILLIIILPIKKIDYVKIFKNNKIIRLIITIYLFLMLSLVIAYSSSILNHWFYHKTPYFLIVLLLSLTIVLISRSYKFIQYFGFILGIIVLLFNLLPIFNSIPRSIDFLIDIDLKIDYLLILSFLFMFLDLIFLFPNLNYLNNSLKKKNLIITISLSTLLSLILLLENYFFFNDNFIKNSVNPNFLKYKIYFINYLIDNIDIILLINILYFITIKGANYLFIIKEINHIKSIGKSHIIKVINLVLTVSFTMIGYFILNQIFDNRLVIKNYTNFLNILIIIIYFYVLIKGGTYEKKLLSKNN